MYRSTINIDDCKEVRKNITLPFSLYDTSGKIQLEQMKTIKDDEKFELDVKIREYPELVVRQDGVIDFYQNKLSNKKYKSVDVVHIDGSITIFEPNFEYKYVKTSYETIYVKEHYKERIVGTIMCEDIFKSYFDHETYHTEKEYEEDKINICKRVNQTKVILDEDMDIDYSDPNINYELVRYGFKVKDKILLENHLTKYRRCLVTNKIYNLMRDNHFVKSLTIKTNEKNFDGSCILLLNGFEVAEIPFNKKFDLTEKNNSYLYYFHELTRFDKIDGLFADKFNNISIVFRDLIEDFDVIIEDVNLADSHGNCRFY